MLVISSKENDTIKRIKKLKEKKYRDEYSKFLIEGIKIVNEAFDNNANIENIIICEELLESNNSNSQLKELKDKINQFDEEKKIYVTEDIIKILSDVMNPQGVMAIINKRTNLDINYNEDVILVLDNIQDPGNLGTIIRTADSCDLKQIIITKETADPYNSKVLRSTMGAIFRVAIIESEDIVNSIQEMKENGFELVTTSLQTDNLIYDIDYHKKIIVIGNEANGVEEKIENISDIRVKIPMLGKTESLNASVATGIILYEYIRKKIKLI